MDIKGFFKTIGSAVVSAAAVGATDAVTSSFTTGDFNMKRTGAVAVAGAAVGVGNLLVRSPLGQRVADAFGVRR